MSQKVHLTLNGRQKDGTGEISVARYSGDGEYFEKNGSIYLLYEETLDGAAAIAKNTLKLKNSVLELTRRGAASTRMVFEPGKEYLADYATPYGCLKMEISTHSLDVCREEGTLKVSVTYTLASDGIPISGCSLEITAQMGQ